MNSNQISYYLTIWSGIGFLAFSLYVILAFRSGIVYSARKQDGTIKENIPASGIVNMLLFLLLIIGFLCLSNYFGLIKNNISLNFLSLLMLNYAHYFILFVFDNLVIDWLVLSIWRPSFLKLPDVIGKMSMMKHILISLPIGLVAGIVLTLISSTISYYLWF